MTIKKNNINQISSLLNQTKLISKPVNLSKALNVGFSEQKEKKRNLKIKPFKIVPNNSSMVTLNSTAQLNGRAPKVESNSTITK